MGKSSGAPVAPDPVATANAQTQSNKDTAITQQRLNQINEITPYGNSTYSPTGTQADGVDLYQRTTTLAPSQQRQLDLQNALQEQLLGAAGPEVGRINNIVSQPFNFNGLPAAPVQNEAARQQVQDALYKRATAQMDPMYAEQARALETKLANQGFSNSSEGYRTSMDDFARQRAGAYDNALQGAIAGGGAEQSRLFGLDTSARNNAISEASLLRSQPINELATLLGQAGAVQTPQFQSAPQTSVAGTDIAGLTNAGYQNQLNAYNAQQQRQNASMGSLFGLAGSALGAWL